MVSSGKWGLGVSRDLGEMEVHDFVGVERSMW